MKLTPCLIVLLLAAAPRALAKDVTIFARDLSARSSNIAPEYAQYGKHRDHPDHPDFRPLPKIGAVGQ